MKGNVSGSTGWTDQAQKKYAAILKKYKIDARYHAAFVEFVETGEVTTGNRGFLDVFEADAAYQQAVEKAFALRIGNLRTALRSLKTP